MNKILSHVKVKKNSLISERNVLFTSLNLSDNFVILQMKILKTYNVYMKNTVVIQ